MTKLRHLSPESLEDMVDRGFRKLLKRLDETGKDGEPPTINHVASALSGAVNWIKVKRKLTEDETFGSALTGGEHG